MIRPLTAVCMLLAGGAGLYLYQAKHTSQLLDREITRTVRQADTARERIGVLRAEYTLLNDPERLQELATVQLASLKNTAPTQFTTWAEFEKRLPPVGAPPVEAPPLEPEAPNAKLPDPKPVTLPDAKPEPKAEPARPVATSRQAPATSPVAVAVAAVAVPRPAPRPPAQTQAAPPPRPAVTPVSLTAALSPSARIEHTRPAAPPRPAQREVAPREMAPREVAMSALEAHPPAAAPPRPTPTSYTEPGYSQASYSHSGYVPPSGSPAEAVARIARGGPVDPAVPAVASALGMARSIVAPRPVTPASAAAIWQPGGGQTSGGR